MAFTTSKIKAPKCKYHKKYMTAGPKGWFCLFCSKRVDPNKE